MGFDMPVRLNVKAACWPVLMNPSPLARVTVNSNAATPPTVPSCTDTVPLLVGLQVNPQEPNVPVTGEVASATKVAALTEGALKIAPNINPVASAPNFIIVRIFNPAFRAMKH